jgi:hypothetical protein
LAIDRTVRLLTSLNRASTSRVLNLAMIAQAHAEDPDHRRQPLFVSPALNSCILLKHRVRADDSYVLGDSRAVATKIIIPFDPADLKAGGRSFLVGQRGFRDLLAEVGQYRGDTGVERDIKVLQVIARVPSLDPFLLREQLRGNGFTCADCYFEINPADQQRMHAYVSTEVHRLIELAGAGGDDKGSTAKLVAALLSNEVDEKLEPLRLTLGMSPGDFREGVFSWRGFLYYKWSMEEQWPQIVEVLKEVKNVTPVGAIDNEIRTFLNQSQMTVLHRVREGGMAVKKILGIYDTAFDAMVSHNTPRTFRDFLQTAPHLFIDLGEKMGAISHIVSFWRYRFPQNSRLVIDCEELQSIFHDFNSSFASVAAPSRAA